MSSGKDNNPFDIFHPEPLMVVISGPAGVGKDTVIMHMKKRNLPFHFVVTATTRPPRKDEVHGSDYFFVSKDDFAEMINQDELIEYAVVYTDHKGIPKEQVRQALKSGKDVVMRLDVQGAGTIKELYPDALLIFLITEDEEQMIDQLKIRKSETPEGLNLRIATARQELKMVNEFDYIVVNKTGNPDEAVNVVISIIEAEHHRVQQRKVAL